MTCLIVYQIKEIHLYADDATAFAIGKNEDEIVTLLTLYSQKLANGAV